ncbi:MAG: hypothetical protein ACYDHW_04735 [Syntrophorhabdaceae bacterium]
MNRILAQRRDVRLFPARAHPLHWTFEDPAALTGTREYKLEKMRHIRDSIREKVLGFIAETA